MKNEVFLWYVDVFLYICDEFYINNVYEKACFVS